MFATTIRANISMGKEGATEEEIQAAAKSANAHAFITALPKGSACLIPCSMPTYPSHDRSRVQCADDAGCKHVAAQRQPLVDISFATSSMQVLSVEACTDIWMEMHTTVKPM